VISGAALAISLAGCNVFDESLWMEAARADAAAPDGPVAPDANAADVEAPDAPAEPDVPAAPDVPTTDTSALPDAPADSAALPDVAPPSPLTDQCVYPPAVTVQSSMTVDIDTRNYQADKTGLQGCAGHDLPGPDLFFGVQMKANERWHFHVNPKGDFDPAIYVLNNCDERTCSPTTVADECGPGKPEHLSFVAPQSGYFMVGIDSAGPGGAATLVVVKPICGDGLTDHSETCDDGNTVSGDGCDALCRRELSMAYVSEMEPNDDPRAANVLAAGRAGGITVSAALGTRCDHDLYSVRVGPSGTLHAVISATMVSCGAENAPIQLALLGSNGQTPIPATITTSAQCPTLDAKNLPADEYFLQVRRSGGEATLPYQLLVEAP
jgi:cysteine-rich repeat protein